jgi:hypothetical protein
MKLANDEIVKLAARLAGYSAATTVLMALAPSANGQIVYSGRQEIPLNFPAESCQLDMDNDGIIDFAFYLRGSSTQYSTNGYYVKYAGGYGVIVNARTAYYANSWIDRTTLRGYYYTYYGSIIPLRNNIVDGLDVNSSVGSSHTNWAHITSPYWDGALGVGERTSVVGPSFTYYADIMYGDFIGEEKFIGVRFHIGTLQHYGWIRVRMDDFLSPMSIVDWAYELTPGVRIVTSEIADNQAPVAILDAGITETSDPVVMVHLTFNENVIGPELEDFVLQNGYITNWITIQQGREYYIEVTASNMGEVILGLLNGSVTDYAGNGIQGTMTKWIYSVLATPDDLSGLPVIYPNPVNDILFIELPVKSDIIINNLSGRELYRNGSVNACEIDFSSYPAGMYIVTIKSERKVEQRKIIKN